MSSYEKPYCPEIRDPNNYATETEIRTVEKAIEMAARAQANQVDKAWAPLLRSRPAAAPTSGV
ncbi:MAG: hypothetical protein OEY91_05965 [Nitrospirota bacterium]|nr:hypothetical protein [Nitrospirota bacterium]